MLNTVFGSNPEFGRAFAGAGSAAAPSLSFFGEPTLGFYRFGAAVMGFAAGGSFSLLFGAGGQIFNAAGGTALIAASNGSLSLYSTGTNQPIYMTPIGSGTVFINNAGNGLERLTFFTAPGYASIQSAEFGVSVRALVLNSAGGNILVGTTTDSGNGRIQLATHTAATGGIGFGTEISLYRTASYALYTNANFTVGGSLRSNTSDGGIGYSTGAGGTFTQGTSKATALTLSKVCGAITTHNASLAANTNVSFVWTNTAIAATDCVHIQHESGGTLGAYQILCTPAAGSATVTIRNITAGPLSEALVLRFAVIKAVAA